MRILSLPARWHLPAAAALCAGLLIPTASGTTSTAQAEGRRTTPAGTHCDRVPVSRQSQGWHRAGWRLVWQDEFDGPGIDDTQWSHQVGDHGWGNRELQRYTDRPENAYIQDGHLVIEARREAHRARRFTSARLTTRNSFAFRYGRIEARIRVPKGRGLWSAFWLLGADYPEVGWPQSGEIDVMETIGSQPRRVHGTVHGPGYSGADGIGSARELTGYRTYAEDFYRYSIEWDPDAIRWYVDDKRFFAVTPADLPGDWVFDHPFYLIVNLAVGGTWPGNPGRQTRFPQKMWIDYVRIYQRCEDG